MVEKVKSAFFFALKAVLQQLPSISNHSVKMLLILLSWYVLCLSSVVYFVYKTIGRGNAPGTNA